MAVGLHIVSLSLTPGASDPTACLPSPGLISSRTRNRSATAARSLRTPSDYGFGRRPSTTSTSRPSTPRRRSPTSRTTTPPTPPVSRPTPTSHASRTPSPFTTPLPEPAAEPDGDPHVHPCVEHTREQRVEHVCSTIIRFLSLDRTAPTPEHRLDSIQSLRRPLRSDIFSTPTTVASSTTNTCDTTCGPCPAHGPAPERLCSDVHAPVVPSCVPHHHFLSLGYRPNARHAYAFCSGGYAWTSRSAGGSAAPGQVYKQTVEFGYLGGPISADGDLRSVEVTRRIQKAWAYFGRYEMEIYDRPSVRLRLKVRMLKAEFL